MELTRITPAFALQAAAREMKEESELTVKKLHESPDSPILLQLGRSPVHGS